MRSIVLAAGLSSRMGKQKLLLPFEGRCVLEHVIENMTEAGLVPIHAVLSDEVNKALTLSSDNVLVLINEHPEQGQSSSLAIALESIPDGEDFCIMLGDLPLVKAEAAESLFRKFLQMPENKSVLAPSRDGIFGHPIFYRSVWRDRFRLASGDVGGKKILMKYECEIMRTKVSDEHFKDIDTPEEYRNLLRT